MDNKYEKGATIRKSEDTDRKLEIKDG